MFCLPLLYYYPAFGQLFSASLQYSIVPLRLSVSLTGIVRISPHLHKQLPQVWIVASNWGFARPIERQPLIPYIVLQAIVVLSPLPGLASSAVVC